MIIGIPKESQNFESRVAIAPDTIKKLVKLGHQVYVESNAGMKSSFRNEDYIETGAKISDSTNQIYSSDIILKINALSNEELELIDSEKTIICFFQIKDEVEKTYGVKVISVRTMVYRGKKKSKFTKTGVVTGKTNTIKKALVRLEKDNSIDYYEY